MRLLIVLWAGSLWALALWVAPVSFRVLADRHQAGLVALQLFRIETYLTLALAIVVLARFGLGRLKAVQLACLALLINEWILRPVMQHAAAGGRVLGLNFAAWHGASGALYVVACLAAVLVVWQNDFG